MLAWALTVVGLTTIITQSRLFAPIRRAVEFKIGSKFLYCPMCIGFWVGLGLSFFQFGCCSTRYWLLTHLADGCASSGANWIVYIALVKLGAHEL
jgi:hypothetical protein